jgi:hypothetical protein
MKGAVEMEAKGLKMSRGRSATGRSATAMAMQELGIEGKRATPKKRAEVLQKLEAAISQQKGKVAAENAALHGQELTPNNN